jgi:hypothetical protein
MFSGAVATVAGIAVAATAPVLGTAAAARVELQQTVGGVVVLAGWVALGWGIHRLGRQG